MLAATPGYAALVSGCGWFDFSRRTQIEMTGGDRAKFLHNLCTADIKRLSPGQGCEAFLTNVQGKILGYVYIFAGPQSLVLETIPDAGPALLAHLDRYLIREDVQLVDRSQDWGELLVAGPHAADLLEKLCAVPPPAQLYGHSAATLAGRTVWLRRVDFAGPDSFFLACFAADLSVVSDALTTANASACTPQDVEAARIEAGSPLYGADITEKNLPQEVGRDQRAISFTKGCYLGQETVARIDALGHVNRLLVGVKFSGSLVPEPGAGLHIGDKSVGAVTSAALSPRHSAPLALAYVRREDAAPGTQLSSSLGAAEVVPLPVR